MCVCVCVCVSNRKNEVKRNARKRTRDSFSASVYLKCRETRKKNLLPRDIAQTAGLFAECYGAISVCLAVATGNSRGYSQNFPETLKIQIHLSGIVKHKYASRAARNSL